MAHRSGAVRINPEPGGHFVGNAELLQNSCDMNPGRRDPGVGNENRIRGKQGGAQARGILDVHLRIAGANRERGLDETNVGDRGGDDKILFRQFRDDGRRQDDDVGRRALAQFIGHGTNRAEFACDVEPGHLPERRRKARDQALGRAAAENVQACHELNSMAAIRLSRVIGRLRTRNSSASKTALAIAAVTGP